MDSIAYVAQSLELHLFFGRIMKEHALFLRAGFTPASPSFSKQAEFYKCGFEKLLHQALVLSGGTVSREVLCSGELVTEFTAQAETQTQRFTGIPIDQGITAEELRLNSGCFERANAPDPRCQTQQLNRTALKLLDGLISFKESILRGVSSCQMFTLNYPLLLEHILREAKLYRQFLWALEQKGALPCQTMKETECFWNRIMMEHAMFIRGLLDPAEEALFRSADDFAQTYARLLEACDNAQRRTMAGDSLTETIKFRDFKVSGVQGITQCKIRSVILPLLADHVLREANHYLRLLEA